MIIILGELFLHIARIARAKRPKMLLLENVPGLVHLQGGLVLRTVLRALSRCGYAVAYKVIDAVSLVPQYRKRIYIVGVRKDIIDFLTTVSSSMSSSSSTQHHSSHVFAFPNIPHLYRTTKEVLEPRSAIRSRHLLPAEKWAKATASSIYSSRKHWKLANLDRPAGTLVTSYRRGYLYNSQFVALSPMVDREKDQKNRSADARSNEEDKTADASSNPSPVAANGVGSGDGGDDERCITVSDRGCESAEAPVRYFTEREAARIMGFPEDFILPIPKDDNGSAQNIQQQQRQKQHDLKGTGAYGLLGNAVVPPLIACVGYALLDYVHQFDPARSHYHSFHNPHCDSEASADVTSGTGSCASLHMSSRCSGSSRNTPAVPRWLYRAMELVIEATPVDQREKLLDRTLDWESQDRDV